MIVEWGSLQRGTEGSEGLSGLLCDEKQLTTDGGGVG